MSLEPGKPVKEIPSSANEDRLTAKDKPIKALGALPEASLLLKPLWLNHVKRLRLTWSPVYQIDPLSRLAHRWRNHYLKAMPQERATNGS